MAKVRQTVAILIYGLIGLALLLPACRPAHPLVGKWRAAPPSSLLFEYGNDGAVLLLKDSTEFVVFHYKLIDDDSVQLFDGMGRVRQYDFSISGGTLTFYEKGEIAETYTREE